MIPEDIGKPNVTMSAVLFLGIDENSSFRLWVSLGQTLSLHGGTCFRSFIQIYIHEQLFQNFVIDQHVHHSWTIKYQLKYFINLLAVCFFAF